jgi:hypothetical protein
VKPIQAAELLDLTRYELERDRIRARVIELKRRARRIAVGNELTFIFENRDTVHFQIQEMLRTERIVKPESIQEELDVYNALLPGANELSATLMIEIPEAQRIREVLDRLVGIDEHVFFDIGDRSVQASFDPKQFEQDRISAVQYIRFALGPELAARFRDAAVPVALRVEHPQYRESTPIDGERRRSLAADLGAD